MTIAAIDSGPAAPSRARLPVVPLWGWWLVAVAATTALALFSKGTGRAFEFIDSDDALRFVHVRELLAGAPWFEVTTKALGGSEGLVSHWSRLIDGPMALLLGGLQMFLTGSQAREAVVTIWPVAMLAAVLWAIARTTDEVAGKRASLLALAFGATSLLTYYQFAPGRIDHHNVMIATTVAAALIIWAWPPDARGWRWSGVLCAIALSIGYEALAPVFLIAGLAAGWGLLDRAMSRHAASFVVGLVATLALVFVATVAPSRWLTIACDALSLNLVVLAVSAGAAFVAVMHNDGWSWPRRIAVLAAGSAVGIAAFGALEPACLAGPMGQVPAELGPVWMDQVDEAKSLLREMLRGELGGTTGPVLIFAVGLAVTVAALASSARPADRFLLAAAAGFVLLALWQMKYLAYASLILVPGIAIFVSRLPAFGNVGAPIVMAIAALLLNQFMLFTLALTLRTAVAPAASSPPSDAAAAAAAGSPQLACTRQSDLSALAEVPAGLVVTHNDIGAHLAVATPHRALAGPYHRIPAAILANHRILSAAEPREAARALAAAHVDYILTCRPMDAAQIARPGWDRSLLASLAAGDAPDFLVPVPLQNAPLYRMWRVDRDRLPAP